jgi:hypothetical protein
MRNVGDTQRWRYATLTIRNVDDAQRSPEIETAHSALRFRALGIDARTSMLLRDNEASLWRGAFRSGCKR